MGQTPEISINRLLPEAFFVKNLGGWFHGLSPCWMSPNGIDQLTEPTSQEYFRENHPNHRPRFCLFDFLSHRINQHDLLHRL